MARAKLKKSFRLPITIKRKARYPVMICGFEIKKLCTILTAIVMAAGIVITCYLADDAYNLQRNFNDNFYTEYMTKLEGPWTEEKHAVIEEDYRATNEMISRKGAMDAAYKSGEITNEEYNQYLFDYLNAQTRVQVLERLFERSNYLKEKTEEGYSVAYFDDTGWNLLRGTNLAWVMCLAIIVILADVFSLEYRSGFVQIQSVTRKGRVTVMATKFVVSAVIALVLGLCGVLIEFFLVVRFSGLPGASYMALGMELETSLSVGGYFALVTMKQLGLFVLLSVMTAGLSRLTKKLIPTLLILTVLVFAPMIFSYFEVTLFDKISFLNLFAR